MQRVRTMLTFLDITASSDNGKSVAALVSSRC